MTTETTCRFRSPTPDDRGLIAELLEASYAELLAARPEQAVAYRAAWAATDRDTFDHPDTIGRCVLISERDGDAVGFVSWDPRRLPEEGEIGQHCIAPAHRGHGLGTAQVREAMRLLREGGARRIVASTEDHPVFAPAAALYRACGFHEEERTHTERFGGLELIRFAWP
ncbi:MAG: N-acetyltransferase family protein [Planctomycetota bacterium]